MTDEHWSRGYLIAFDVETTGTDVFNDRIVTAAVVHAKPEQRPRTLTWVVDPGVPIAPEAAAIHGWTADKIATWRHPTRGTRASAPAQAMFEIAGQVALAMSTGTPLVVFNGAFDLSMLQAECVRQGVPSLTDRLDRRGLRGVVDPFVIDKRYSRRKNKCECGCGATSRQLGEQCKHYKVRHTGAHDAGGDALATLRLVDRMVAAYPDLAAMPFAKLHQAQKGWRASQMNSLRSYFDREGKEHDGCDGSWPLRMAPELAVA